jgi:hypothetical protein
MYIYIPILTPFILIILNCYIFHNDDDDDNYSVRSIKYVCAILYYSMLTNIPSAVGQDYYNDDDDNNNDDDLIMIVEKLSLLSNNN